MILKQRKEIVGLRVALGEAAGCSPLLGFLGSQGQEKELLFTEEGDKDKSAQPVPKFTPLVLLAEQQNIHIRAELLSIVPTRNRLDFLLNLYKQQAAQGDDLAAASRDEGPYQMQPNPSTNPAEQNKDQTDPEVAEPKGVGEGAII